MVMRKDSANIGYGYYFCQALPIFLDSLVVAWGAVLISVTLILLFGEVGNFSSPYMFNYDYFISGNNSDQIIRSS